MTTRECKACKQTKPYGWFGRRQAAGRKVFTAGPEGLIWRGLLCGECFMSQSRKASSGQECEGEGPELTDPVTTRKCRMCSKLLRASRYFCCLSCHNSKYQDGDGEYDAVDYGYSCHLGAAHVW